MVFILFNLFVLLVLADENNTYQLCCSFITIIIQLSVCWDVIEFTGVKEQVRSGCVNVVITLVDACILLYFLNDAELVQMTLFSLCAVVCADLFMISVYADRLQRYSMERRYQV